MMQHTLLQMAPLAYCGILEEHEGRREGKILGRGKEARGEDWVETPLELADGKKQRTMCGKV